MSALLVGAVLAGKYTFGCASRLTNEIMTSRRRQVAAIVSLPATWGLVPGKKLSRLAVGKLKKLVTQKTLGLSGALSSILSLLVVFAYKLHNFSFPKPALRRNPI